MHDDRVREIEDRPELEKSVSGTRSASFLDTSIRSANALPASSTPLETGDRLDPRPSRAKIGGVHFSGRVSLLKGEIVFVDGQAANRVYRVLSGKVKISVGKSNGTQVLIRVVERGEMFGLAAALTGSDHRSTAEALGRCELASVPREAFLLAMGDDPAGLGAIVRQISRNYNEALEVISMVSSRSPVRVRLAQLFVTWLPSESFHYDQATFANELTHEQIGEMVGATRETVSRTLKELSRQKVVTLKHRKVIVHNINGLKKIAGD